MKQKEGKVFTFFPVIFFFRLNYLHCLLTLYYISLFIRHCLAVSHWLAWYLMDSLGCPLTSEYHPTSTSRVQVKKVCATLLLKPHFRHLLVKFFPSYFYKGPLHTRFWSFLQPLIAVTPSPLHLPCNFPIP